MNIVFGQIRQGTDSEPDDKWQTILVNSPFPHIKDDPERAEIIARCGVKAWCEVNKHKIMDQGLNQIHLHVYLAGEEDLEDPENPQLAHFYYCGSVTRIDAPTNPELN